MGYALARAALRRGAEVVLVSGPVALEPPPGASLVAVRTAEEMLQACLKHFDEADVVIKAAAVSDFRPKKSEDSKIKREGRDELALEFQPNPDILEVMGSRKGQRITVGFAAETEELVANAAKKLHAKKVDLMVVNDVSRPDIGFDQDYNEVTLCYADGRTEPYPKMDKLSVAQVILDAVVGLRAGRPS
jgi:phosphopantothenoylcysteine decarboxylase/phosphopantothenate--cysteine ligase